jgi:REP element-mobilizing transposase RayT
MRIASASSKPSPRCALTGWQVHAFCLLPNHFHLVVETPQPNLVAGMKWFLGTYRLRSP